MNFEGIGKLMVLVGILLLIAGGGFMLFGKLGLGRLPGDFEFSGGHWKVYFPFATSILLSLLLTLVLNVIARFWR